MAVAILLVGGFGTRLMPLTKNTHKPMLTVAGIPVTEHQLMMAKAAGIKEIVLATSIERNAPIRFITAAIATAVRGLSAPVAIGVAIALAVS